MLLSEFLSVPKSATIIGIGGMGFVNTLDCKAFGARLRKAREAKGLTQESLAELCDKSVAHIGHIERGDRLPSLDVLYTIACALSVSVDSLMFDSGTSEEPSFSTIASIIQDKDKATIKTFMGVVRVLADHIDEI